MLGNSLHSPELAPIRAVTSSAASGEALWETGEHLCAADMEVSGFEAQMNRVRVKKATYTQYQKKWTQIVRAGGSDSFMGVRQWLAKEFRRPVPRRGAAKRGERRSVGTLRSMVSAAKYIRRVRGADDWTPKEEQRVERVLEGMTVEEERERAEAQCHRNTRQTIDGERFKKLYAWATTRCWWFAVGIHIIWGAALRPGDIEDLTKARVNRGCDRAAGTNKLPEHVQAKRRSKVTWRPVMDPGTRGMLQQLREQCSSPDDLLLPEWDAPSARAYLAEAVAVLGWPTRGRQWCLHGLRHGAATDTRAEVEAAVIARGGWANKSRAARGYARYNAER